MFFVGEAFGQDLSLYHIEMKAHFLSMPNIIDLFHVLNVYTGQGFIQKKSIYSTKRLDLNQEFV